MIKRTEHYYGVSYSKDGMYCRLNGPAKMWDDGLESWYLDGRRHRYYGPQNKKGVWFVRDHRIK